MICKEKGETGETRLDATDVDPFNDFFVQKMRHSSIRMDLSGSAGSSHSFIESTGFESLNEHTIAHVMTMILTTTVFKKI